MFNRDEYREHLMREGKLKVKTLSYTPPILLSKPFANKIKNLSRKLSELKSQNAKLENPKAGNN